MQQFELKDVHELAASLFWEMEMMGDIFPPAEMCKTNDGCWLFVRDRNLSSHSDISSLLSKSDNIFSPVIPFILSAFSKYFLN